MLGFKKTGSLPVPIISIGNLTAGGTGKTPMVALVAQRLRDEGASVTILSRGYGATAGNSNDEALVLSEICPDVPHLQGADRIALGQTAIDELGASVLVLDDGFQHHRIARDIDIVLIDATCPWGHGHLLPRGLLREPRSALKRANLIVLTRCDQIQPQALASLSDQVKRAAPGIPILESAHKPSGLSRTGHDDVLPSSWLEGRSVAAFCGLGRPEAFRKTLEHLGARILEWRIFPDHHPYNRDDIRSLSEWAAGLPEGTPVICTHKDLVKIQLSHLAGSALYRLDVSLELQDNNNVLDSLLSPVVHRALEIEEAREESEDETTP
jgi:tetraacyldisaccharide 4'-kinase